MLTVHIFGGLGNQLFQLAFMDYVHRRMAIPYYIKDVFRLHRSPHETVKYFYTIFKDWLKYFKENEVVEQTIHEEWEVNLDNIQTDNVEFIGYFQHYKYISEDFKKRLSFSTDVISQYPDVSDSVFLHIRGGDYIHQFPDIHDCVKNDYYEKAVQYFPPDTNFYIFTNDIEYANSFPVLDKIKHRFIHENEIDSLYLMSHCKGGICANSTFSWWGAYLNPKRTLILPSKWFNTNDHNTSGYYFDGCIVVDN